MCKAMKMEGYGAVGLCNDVLGCIISRLPSISLARFRCVSKQWSQLISDVSSYHRRPTSRPGLICTLQRRPYTSDDDEELYIDHTIFLAQDARAGLAVKPSLSFSSIGRLTIAASCDGLILLLDAFEDLQFCVCNPTTGQFLRLPLIPETFIRQSNTRHAVFALAFDGQHFEVFYIAHSQPQSIDITTYNSSSHRDRDQDQWLHQTVMIDSKDKDHRFNKLVGNERCIFANKYLYWIINNEKLLTYKPENTNCRAISLPKVIDLSSEKANKATCLTQCQGQIYYCHTDPAGICLWALEEIKPEDEGGLPRHPNLWRLHHIIRTGTIDQVFGRRIVCSYYFVLKEFCSFSEDPNLLYLLINATPGKLLLYDIKTENLREVFSFSLRYPSFNQVFPLRYDKRADLPCFDRKETTTLLSELEAVRSEAVVANEWEVLQVIEEKRVEVLDKSITDEDFMTWAVYEFNSVDFT